MIEEVELTAWSALLHLLVFQFPVRATWSLTDVCVPNSGKDHTWPLMLVGIPIPGENHTWSLTPVGISVVIV